MRALDTKRAQRGKRLPGKSMRTLPARLGLAFAGCTFVSTSFSFFSSMVALGSAFARRLRRMKDAERTRDDPFMIEADICAFSNGGAALRLFIGRGGG